MPENNTIKAAIIGYGNVGKEVLDALEVAPDFTIAGVVRRDPFAEQPRQLQDIPVEGDIKALGDVDVAILALPSRLVGAEAEKLLARGIRTVDSFDIHDQILAQHGKLDAVAKAHHSVAVLAAGWDPGSDSVVRTLMQAMLPQGLTYTNFGPGRSMGHTVAVKAIEGVEDALSLTIPKGTGLHRRMVYVKKNGLTSEEEIKQRILSDPYFSHDETHILFVEDIDALQDVGHAVDMSRKGVSGKTHNQQVSFRMSINNPALTAQVMVASARAAMRLPSGAYILPEIPVIDLLPGERSYWIDKLC